MVNKILTFGEPLFINFLNTNENNINNSKFSYNSTLSFGGSEISTSVALTNLKKKNKVYLLSCFPDTRLGKQYLENLEDIGIDINFVEISILDDLIKNIYIKNNKIFDQDNYFKSKTTFSNLSPNYFDTNKIFHNNYDWVHLNGNTPLISENCKTVWLNILKESIKLNLPISCDLTNIDITDWDKIWDLIKDKLNKLESIIITDEILDIIINNLEKEYNNLIEEQHISKKNSEDNKLKFIYHNYDINKLYLVSSKRVMNNYKISQTRYSILIYLNKIYKSEIKEYYPNNTFGCNDYFIASIINSSLNEKKESFYDILNKAEIYTILNQENKSLFSEIEYSQLCDNFKIFKTSKNENNITV